MSEHVKTHETSFTIISGYGSGDLGLEGEPDTSYVWAIASNDEYVGEYKVHYEPISCAPFPQIQHALRQRAIYQAVREVLKLQDPAP